MPIKKRKKVTTVREHPLRVPVSQKNPTGITIRDKHLRRLKGTYLDLDEIELLLKQYERIGITYPSAGRLSDFKDSDKYDDSIAVWTDYFNKKFNIEPPLDPDVVKALIATESGFRIDPKENYKAFGITQITPKTLKILQDATGETKSFIFRKVRQKDLKNPNIAIPLAVRWLLRKRETAMNRLNRIPNNEELILEYKGLLKSKTPLKSKAIDVYRKYYDLLKKK